MSGADLHTLTGAYALHALPDAERTEFERHLRVCEACRQEVRELSATAGRLGLAMTVTPAPEMKDAVLRRIATVRQEPPALADESRRRGDGRRTQRLSRFVLAACVAAAAAFGGIAVWQHQRAEQAQEQAQDAQRRATELADVLAAPDAKATTAKLGNGASGTVVVSHSRNQAAFVTAGMPKPPGGKVYQLWFDDDGTMRSAGLMDPDRPTGSVLLDGPVNRATGMGITVEPAGGSEQPTSDPLALMEFPA